MSHQRSNTKTPDRNNKTKRPDRVKMNAGNKLNAPEREGYQRYWAVDGPDHPGKIDQMKAAWWEIVKREDGTDWTIPAGGGNTHVLMQIEQNHYDEDIDDQQKLAIDASQKNMQSLGEDEYIPMGKRDVVEREII